MPTHAPADEDAARQALVQSIGSTTGPLHGIVSRSDPNHIAAEVARLNLAVRTGSHDLFDADSQPADFQRVLLEGADTSNALPPETQA